MYIVYKVKIMDSIRYIGYTNDIKRRQYNHNYLLKKGKKKILYDELRKLNILSIELLPIKYFKTKVEAKRYECLLILNDHFTNKQLLQKVPRISDM